MTLKACMSVMRMPQKAIMNQVVRQTTLQKPYRSRQKIVELLVSDKFITTTQMAIQTGKSRQTIATRIKAQQEWGVVKRKEPDKGGFWGILQNFFVSSGVTNKQL